MLLVDAARASAVVALAGLAPAQGGPLTASTFQADITPPIGAPLCDALVLPARKIVDRLAAKGIVLRGAGAPLVLCALDWVGVGNGGYDAWRAALAEAAETTPERVQVHCLHPHDTPGCDFEAEALLADHGLGGAMFDPGFARVAIRRAADALRASLQQAVPVTALAIGRAAVADVASNRRVLGPDGKVAHVRFSKCEDPAVRAAPEGLIDRHVRVVGLCGDDPAAPPVAVLSYYATHPQSHYGSGGVSPDFVGLARERAARLLGHPHWVHFNGAGGNVAAGKYNDGAPARREELTEKLADGMRRAWQAARRVPLAAADVALRSAAVALPPAPHLDADVLARRLADPAASRRDRVRAARDLVWLRRARAGRRIDLACLELGPCRLLHLPGEAFVEYQLFASALRPDLVVCTAAYGDYGPGYIGTEVAYAEGGYETGPVSRVAPAVEAELRRGIRSLLFGDAGYFAGVARVEITPKTPLPLAGYASRTEPSSGTLTPLWAKALALVDPQGNRRVLISADLLGVPKELADAVCARLAREEDLPRAAIVLATSHTHTGPALTDHLAPMYGFDQAAREAVARYTQWLEDRLVDVARQALRGVAPARLSWGQGTCDVAVNRRNNKEAAVPRLREKGALRGPVDHDVPVLRVTGTDGALRAVVFGYACHCTVLNTRQFSGDYAGFAQIDLERRHPGATALFFAGCGGDQNPLPRRAVDLAKRYGDALAASVDAVLGRPMRDLTGPLQATFGTTPLRFERLPDAAELRVTEADAAQNVYERRRARWLLAQLARRGRLQQSYPYPVQAWQLGDGPTLVALGGEVVVDYALALKDAFGRERTWVAAYCNDVMAYVPSRRVWHEGGYEGGGAMVYYGQPSRWAESVEDVVMDAARRAVAAVRGTAAPSVAAELPRIPPRAPADAARAFEVQDGFRVELVAAEPHVVDPVDMQIDERGRIWVVEMIDYPFDQRDGHSPAGRVRVLEDTDGDGAVDKSTVFADGLPWPTGLALWQDGVFVTAAPDLLFLRDTDGDLRADRRTVAFTGFGRRNVQTLANNLVLQADGWFTGAGGGNGGSIVVPGSTGPAPVLLRNRDFRFRPGGAFEALPGGGQFGHTIDDFGRRFVCNNSDHARLILFDGPSAEGSAPVSIAADGGAAPVFRRSPPEPWRIVRTRWRLAGTVKGPIEHGGAVAGYFTSATGITVYRGSALPDCDGDLFIGDVASNLVHRKRVVPDGASFRAERRDQGREFLASTDIWFRPTNFANGPDGALYICDMYREVVEHPWSLPDEIKRHLDLLSGNDRGRIWRVTGKEAPRPARVDLATASTASLAGHLFHRDGWWRDTAARLLLQRRPADAPAPVRARLAEGGSPAGTAQALMLLAGLGALAEADVQRGLAHEDARVREVAVRLAARLPVTATLARALRARVDDPAPRVRFVLTGALAAVPEAESAWAQLAARDGGAETHRTALVQAADPTRALAVLQALPATARPEVFAALAERVGDTTSAAAWIEAAALPEPTRAAVVRGLAARGAAAWAALLAGDRPRLRALVDALAARARDATAPVEQRRAALATVGDAPLDAVGGTLAALLDAAHPPDLQAAAVDALARRDDPAAARLMLQGITRCAPDARRRILGLLVQRPSGARLLLDAVEAGRVRAATVPVDAAARLRGMRDPELRRRAVALLGAAPSAERQAVIDRYLPAVRGGGDAKRGLAVFEQSCKVCHRYRGLGTRIGPDLETVRGRDAPALLTQILDPDREVNPAWSLYVAETTDGRTVAGILEQETATAVTLRRADGGREVLQRDRLRQLQGTDRSLMPPGLEATIPPASMADLIAYLRSRE